MRVQSLFRSPSTAPKANAAPESARDVNQATEPVIRGASAESWERARRWSSYE